MSTLVHAGSLSNETCRALEWYSDAHDYVDWLGDRRYIDGTWFAWLIALLKEEPDTPELFPKGKWATIQRMQDLLAIAAREEIAQREPSRSKQT
jgi:hypothetical protein